MIPLLESRSLVSPEQSFIPTVKARVAPKAKRAYGRFSGIITASELEYADLHSYSWWYGGGWLTLNRGKKGLKRVHRGGEDVSRLRRL